MRMLTATIAILLLPVALAATEGTAPPAPKLVGKSTVPSPSPAMKALSAKVDGQLPAPPVLKAVAMETRTHGGGESAVKLIKGVGRTQLIYSFQGKDYKLSGLEAVDFLWARGYLKAKVGVGLMPSKNLMDHGVTPAVLKDMEYDEYGGVRDPEKEAAAWKAKNDSDSVKEPGAGEGVLDPDRHGGVGSGGGGSGGGSAGKSKDAKTKGTGTGAAKEFDCAVSTEGSALLGTASKIGRGECYQKVEAELKACVGGCAKDNAECINHCNTKCDEVKRGTCDSLKDTGLVLQNTTGGE